MIRKFYEFRENSLQQAELWLVRQANNFWSWLTPQFSCPLWVSGWVYFCSPAPVNKRFPVFQWRQTSGIVGRLLSWLKKWTPTVLWCPSPLPVTKTARCPTPPLTAASISSCTSLPPVPAAGIMIGDRSALTMPAFDWRVTPLIWPSADKISSLFGNK